MPGLKTAHPKPVQLYVAPAAIPPQAARARRLVASLRLWLALLMVGLGGYRLSLIGVGRLHFGDERKYKLATFVVEELAKGNLGTAVARLTDPYGGGQPGFILISTIPATLQRLAAKWGFVSIYNLEYFLIPAVLNVGVTLIILLLIYSLVRRWTGSEWTALTTVGVHGLLFNTSAYVRHLLPYDESLALFLYALLIIIREESSSNCSIRRGIVAGALSGLGFACYPGYYAFPVILAAVCLGMSGRCITRLTAYAASSAAVLGAFELLARVSGTSYLAEVVELSSTITMGDFREGYFYVGRYLIDVEGAAGVTILVLCGVFVAFMVWRRGLDLPRSLRVAILTALGCYLWHATMGAVFHYMVFYGRLLHMYMPFLVLGAVMTLTRLPQPRHRKGGLIALTVVALVSFVPSAMEYSALVYPGELFESTVAECNLPIADPARRLWVRSGGRIDHPAIQDRPLVVMVMEEWPDGLRGYVHVASHREARTSDGQLIAVNVNWMFLPDSPEAPFVPPPGYQLIREAVHPHIFAGNAYEAYGPAQRDRLRRQRYHMRIYQRQDAR